MTTLRRGAVIQGATFDRPNAAIANEWLTRCECGAACHVSLEIIRFAIDRSATLCCLQCHRGGFICMFPREESK